MTDICEIQTHAVARHYGVTPARLESRHAWAGEAAFDFQYQVGVEM